MSTRLFRVLAWILVAAIVTLSLVPPSLRQVTGAPHDLEHFAMFALCGFASSLGYRSRHLLHVVALVTFSGLVEVLQFTAPGRHARMIDFVVDAIASCAGVLIGFWTLMQHWWGAVTCPGLFATSGLARGMQPPALQPKRGARRLKRPPAPN
jgi:VanZ family protein